MPVGRRAGAGRWRMSCLLPAVLMSAIPARAQQVLSAPAIPATGPADSLHAPRRLLRSEDWLLGGIMLGTLATTQLDVESFDESLTPHSAEGKSIGRRIPRTLGSLPVAGGVAAGTYLAGAIAASPRVRRVGVHGLEALAVNYVLTSVVKVGVGRSRPDTGGDGDDLHWIAFSSANWSFPSGHTSTMFALATVFSSELHDEAPWVPFVAYPLAAWTGVSRVLDKRHWATDVVAGAALGILSGRLVGRLDPPDDPGPEGDAPRPQLSLVSVGEGVGLGVRISLP